jgi:energy-coupling factor transporter ATP-binding protein EcfA2
MDFYQIKERAAKNGVTEVYPDFKVGRSKDLMVRGKSFYAIWDPELEIWSTDEYDVQRLVDQELLAHRDMLKARTDNTIQVKLMSEFSSNSWPSFRKFMQNISDNSHQLDENLVFANSEVKKKDYVSRRLPYPLEAGSFQAFDELIGTLYDPEERQKLEWAIGAIVAGDAKDIQKFIVLYGEAGAGKSTLLNIIQKLFVGYYTTFEAKALTSNNNSFSTEVFKSNPLVAIQHDGDLSKIEDNTKLNSIVSHEEMTMNEKYKPSYTARVNCFLFMATNRPVKITDAKSGIIRRLIDVRPSGRRIPSRRYQNLMLQVDFELGAIAQHCLDTYREMGKNYYAAYRPLNMILQTDVFFNFVEANYVLLKEQDGITLSQGYDMYKAYCDDALIEFKLPKYKFREEFKNYFENFYEMTRVDGRQIRSYYSGFKFEKLTSTIDPPKDDKPISLVLDHTDSLFDAENSNCFAQYASNDIPSKKWDDVTTKLSDIDTRQTHFVKVPDYHIVIDFDLKDLAGNKSLDLNLEAASKWPPTYAEYSKSGKGVHLHYIYDGDVTKLSRVYDDYIEVKVFTGKSSLRRKLTKCNNVPILTINSGLPLKGEKVINLEVVKTENGLRNLIKKNLNKEIHPGTKSSIDFIYKILEDAYVSDLVYDIMDMRSEILAFANNSTNQAPYCLKLVTTMKFKSDDAKAEIEAAKVSTQLPEEDALPLVFYDVEVFPNLFVIVWKAQGKDQPLVKMINPTAKEVDGLIKLKLVGYNCRRYDNHILYGRYIGYTLEQIFKLSQNIIKGNSSLFREAYGISYTDVYDFSSKKQSLKKFEIELGLHHNELGLDWEKPVPEDMWQTVADYCADDVLATEATFEARKQDFVARLILSELSGLTPNDTTQQHTAAIIFGNDPKPQEKFVYTDLAEEFPGYTFDVGKSLYRGEDPGEGGYVYAEPGMYEEVALLDVASMHPTSLIHMNMFGPYTNNFKQLLDVRLAIKRKEFNKAKKMMGGVLSKYLNNEDAATDLSYALKIVVNIVYGLTSATFSNKFNDPRNIDNIVAKRGALFMIDLKNAVQDQGFVVAHIKTDSIKIPNATPEIIDFVIEFGSKYGYTFEHEDTFKKLCLVNEAVYIAKKLDNTWSATGAQFAQPFVFKTLFSHEQIEFEDFCETKAVSTALYLDFNENLPKDEHDYRFIGKVGQFCPILPGSNAGVLLREKEGKYYAATGSKGWRWLESESVKGTAYETALDRSYYINQVDDAVKTISKYGDFEEFIS